jgi:pyruvate formate-lyase activating enzyme-like uncharacterized protein
VDPEKKKKAIEEVRQSVGWAYADLRWFSEEEAELANQQRNKLLDALSGWVRYSSRRNKPHSGPLSPGCLICGSGGWGCNYINGLCTRRCFYCPQDRKRVEERPSQTDGFTLKDPTDHVQFLKAFHIKGVGFSGGEPFLMPDRLLAHIQAIRKEFGDTIYLWVYTNGDRLTRPALARLREAGLNEIRLDLSARRYDLSPLALARKYIPTVTVEIPAIPEDFGLVKGLLGRLEARGVKYLNLHQLHASRFNYKALLRRGYHFLHQPLLPIFESEICALKLLGYARDRRVALPINYCAAAYKGRFHARNSRQRRARLFHQGHEEITAAGYIRTFRVSDSTNKIALMARRLQKARCPSDSWKRNEKRTEVAIRSALLPYVDWSSADVALLYFAPGVGLGDPAEGISKDNLAPAHQKVYEWTGVTKPAIECWRKLYTEKTASEQAFTSFCQGYPLSGGNAVSRLADDMRALKDVETFEELESGLPEIF